MRRRDITIETIFNMASVRHLEFEKFRFLSNTNPRNGNLHLRTKFDQHRIIHKWVMEMKLFSRWRPSAMLNLRKLQYWLLDGYLHVILHLLFEIRINPPIWRRDIAKNEFQYGVRPPSWIWKISIFVNFPWSEWKFAPVYQIWSKSDNSRLWYGDKAIFKMETVRHHEFEKIAVLVTWPVSVCDSSSYFWILRWKANKAPKYSQKTIFNMASVRHVQFEKFRFFFVKFPCPEWKFTSVCQTRSKSDNSRLRYGDKAIFKMAAVRHLEFAEIAVLVTWLISACDSSPMIRNTHSSVNTAPRYTQNTIFNMAAIRLLEFEKFRLFCQISMPGMEICTYVPYLIKIDLGWDMEIMLFSKWRPSAVLNLRKLQFWSRVLYWHVIMYFQSKLRINRSIGAQILSKNDFQYGVRLPSWVCKISIFC